MTLMSVIREIVGNPRDFGKQLRGCAGREGGNQSGHGEEELSRGGIQVAGARQHLFWTQLRVSRQARTQRT